MIQPPLVSCIMPTYNRRRFIRQAIRCFETQDYPNLELVIVDDGTDPIGDLLPKDPRIFHVRESNRMTIGAKRNLACEMSRGKFIVHWDDDDWYAPARVRAQVTALIDTGADLCGSGAFYYRDVERRSAYLCGWRRLRTVWSAPATHGAMFAYQRSLWRNNPFPDWQTGEDTRFSMSLAEHRIVGLYEPSLFVLSKHRGNTVPPMDVGLRHWQAVDRDHVRAETAIFWSKVDYEIVQKVMAGAQPASDHPTPFRFFSLRGCQICRFHKNHGALEGDPDSRAAYLTHRPLSTMTMADFA